MCSGGKCPVGICPSGRCPGGTCLGWGGGRGYLSCHHNGSGRKACYPGCLSERCVNI